MQVSYPNRPAFFAQRFIRLMIKSAAAQTIGTDAFALLTIVASTEDARRYAGPVAYYNEQLMALLGFGSKKRLVSARNRAIESGWLNYVAGGKSKAGAYFVLVPRALERIPDGPSDESGEFCRSDTEPQTERKVEQEIVCRSNTEPKADPMRNGKGTPDIPSPSPSPKESRSRASFDPVKVEIPSELDNETFKTAWLQWCEHRREIRKRLTPQSTTQQLQELAVMGSARAVRAIKFTIGKGWQGIREPDGQGAQDSQAASRPELRRFARAEA